jgi:hypothetical protein
VKRYSRVEDVVTVGSHPHLIPLIRAEHCYPAAIAVLHSFRLPPIERRPMGFAPPPHSGFAFLAAPELQRLWSIVLTWRPPVYRSDGYLSEQRLASSYARRLFLRMNFVDSVRARFAAYIGQEQALSSLWLWFGRQPWRSGGLELRSSPQGNVHIG